MPKKKSKLKKISIIAVALIISVIFIAGCPKQSYNPKYNFDPPTREWTPMTAQNGSLLFKRADPEMGILVSSLCDRYMTAPLPPLSRELFIGFTDRRVIGMGDAEINGQKAHYIIMEAKLDGTPVKAKAYTFHAGRCIYDIVYFSPPENFDAGLDEFETFAKSFKANE